MSGTLVLRFDKPLALRERSSSFVAHSVLSFLAPLAARALPEVLMGNYLVGFDTIAYYVPTVLRWMDRGFDPLELLGLAPLFYLLTYALALAGIPLTISLKALPPILYGLLGLAVFSFAVKGLGWPSRKGLLASTLSTLYFVGLRISWDMLRCVLGLTLLFLFLALLSECARGSRRSLALLSAIGALVVLAHQLVSAIMFAIVFAVFLQGLSKRSNALAFKLFAACAPSLALFAVVIYANYAVLLGHEGPVTGRSDWLSLMGYASATDAALRTLGFLLFCYLPISPLLFIGAPRLRSLELKAWIAWCFIGMALPFLSPLAPLSYRWALLLNFPLTLFAAEGLEGLRSRSSKIFFAALLASLSISFTFLPAEAAFPYFTLCPQYSPSSMLQNTVSLRDCRDVVEALKWVDDNVGREGVLLVHDAFHGWALLYTKEVEVSCYGYADPEGLALSLASNSRKRLYAIWWAPGLGWHGQARLPPSFSVVYSSGGIVVYEFEPRSMSPLEWRET